MHFHDDKTLAIITAAIITVAITTVAIITVAITTVAIITVAIITMAIITVAIITFKTIGSADLNANQDAIGSNANTPTAGGTTVSRECGWLSVSQPVCMLFHIIEHAI